MGEESDEEQIQKQLEYYTNFENSIKELEKVQTKWNDILDTLSIKTPDRELDLMVNGWLPYQTISSRIFGKTGYYQSGGAFGFRDQLQDCIGMKYIDKNFLKEQIINCASHQFVEGDVLHWWHEETKKGIRTRISDDLLWLVYAVLEYVEFTGDYEFLNEDVEYLKGDMLADEENERYSIFYKSDVKESIYEHCKKSIGKVLSRGIENFPKIGTGDWNDGFDKLGDKGKGESVWLGFFLYDILSRFIPICKRIGENELVSYYDEIKEKLRKNLNSTGWDGRWYKRAITDEGEWIGGIDSKECRIDSLSQSWSVISGAGDNDKKFIAIESAENYLVDKENKIIKLFDPPFENSSIEPGYIKDYLPGVRENGGQYTHSAVWFIIAEAMLGFGDKAVDLAKMICPINHTRTKDDCRMFKLEPYILPADIYSSKGLEGVGGWNWYTGAASWYYRAIVEYILGLKIKNNFIEFAPCISKNWKEYEIKYKYKTSVYYIKVKNPKRQKYRSRESNCRWLRDKKQKDSFRRQW
jgi:cellobiose phosphorylase